MKTRGNQFIARDLYYLDINGNLTENINEDDPQGHEFLKEDIPECDVIITNPPYCCNHEFFEKCILSRKPFALLLPFQTFTTLKFRSYDKDVKLQILVFYPMPSFKKENGTDAQVGEVCWVFGNFPAFAEMKSNYHLDFICK